MNCTILPSGFSKKNWSPLITELPIEGTKYIRMALYAQTNNDNDSESTLIIDFGPILVPTDKKIILVIKKG